MSTQNSILSTEGKLIPLQQWQKDKGLAADKLMPHFSITEKKIGEFQPFVYAEPLLVLFEQFRILHGQPVNINSGFRTHEKQLQLITGGARAAKFSPHEQGMAFDMDTVSYADTISRVQKLNSLAAKLKLSIRLGYLLYWNKDRSTFIHVDVCPMYFAPGKPLHGQPHPVQWERPMSW